MPRGALKVSPVPPEKAPHCIWEIKRDEPEDQAKRTNDPNEAAKSAIQVFNRSRQQLLEQAVCVFKQYPFLKTVHAFFAAGMWVRHFYFNKKDMPRNLGDIATASAASKYFPAFKGVNPVFPLLQTKADETVEFCSIFRKHWEAATESLIRLIQPQAVTTTV